MKVVWPELTLPAPVLQSVKQQQDEDNMNFKIGDKVEKVSGYKWPGVVIAAFDTLAGERRVVVECTTPEVAGALHIYNEKQLMLVD
jgi:hypothetical protein